MNSHTLALNIQRLVDGEISQADRTMLLDYAEQHRDIYRTIALSFVERDVWDHELPLSFDANEPFVGLNPEQSPWIDGNQSRTLRPANGANSETTEPRLTSIDVQGDHPPSLPKRPNGNGNPRRLSNKRYWSSNDSRFHVTVAQLAFGIVVATVLVGVAGGGIGWWMALREFSTGTTANQMTSRKTPLESSHLRSDFNADQERNRPIAIERLDGSPGNPVDDVRPVALTLPSDVQMELLRSGFVVEEQFNYVDVKLDSGQSVPVPVNELRVNYFGNRLYQ